MVKTESANCPTCGGPLDLSDDSVPVIICRYCGNSVHLETIATKGSEIEGLFRLGRNEMNAGNYKKAEELFEKIIIADPKNYQAYFERGICAGRQSSVSNFKFSDVMDGYATSKKYIPSGDPENFIQTAFSALYNHGLNCERLFEKTYANGIDQKDLGSYLEKAYQIIHFYEHLYDLDRMDLRPPKRIVEMTRTLKMGVKGKGNRYDDNCNVIRDWKYQLPPETFKELSVYEMKYLAIVRTQEPHYYRDQEKKIAPTVQPQKKGGMFGRLFS